MKLQTTITIEVDDEDALTGAMLVLRPHSEDLVDAVNDEVSETLAILPGVIRITSETGIVG